MSKKKFSRFNVNRFEISLQAQRGMTLHNWTICCFVLVKILILIGPKLGFKIYGKYRIIPHFFLPKARQKLMFFGLNAN